MTTTHDIDSIDIAFDGIFDDANIEALRYGVSTLNDRELTDWLADLDGAAAEELAIVNDNARDRDVPTASEAVITVTLTSGDRLTGTATA